MPDTTQAELTAALGRLASALDRLASALDGGAAAALLGLTAPPAAEAEPLRITGDADVGDVSIRDAGGRELPLPDGAAQITITGTVRGRGAEGE